MNEVEQSYPPVGCEGSCNSAAEARRNCIRIAVFFLQVFNTREGKKRERKGRREKEIIYMSERSM